MKPVRFSHASKRRGFTLTELAIVLLVIGGVISALWVVAEHTWDNYRVYRANQQVMKMVQNIREYYMNTQQMPMAANADITAQLDTLNLFPTEMRRNSTAAAGQTPIDNAFNDSLTTGPAPANGSLHVVNVACPVGGTGASCFRVQMMGLTQKPCIKLLTLIPVDDAELGIAQVGTQNMSSKQANPVTMVSATTAQSWCNRPGDTNEVDWDFKLHN